MFEHQQYELLDFGEGRKLERFGSCVLDRPSPAAAGVAVADSAPWRAASARYEVEAGGRGRWVNAAGSPVGERGAPEDTTAPAAPWSIRHGTTVLTVQHGSSGNVGVFPEHASNWDWITEQVARCADSLVDRPPRVLNLFAYTGGASLAAAASGAEVTHVDSSAPTVAWAKRNAAVSGLADHPIRWLVDDALRFVGRERRRGNHYDGIIADPPTYGHGPKGRSFSFRTHVDELMAHCGELLQPDPQSRPFLVFSCHVPGFAPDDAASVVQRALPNGLGGSHLASSGALTLDTRDGRSLGAGVCSRWSRPKG